MNPPICIVAGTGSIGFRHLEVTRRMLGVSVVALPVRLSQIKRLNMDGFKTIQNWSEGMEMGANKAIIATNTIRHEDDAVKAFGIGCDVLVEKPLSSDAQSANRVVCAARSADRGLWVGCCLRFQEALNQFRNRLPSIGRIHSVRIECQSFLPDWRPDRPYLDSYSARVDEGGVLRDLIHEIDYAGWLFGWPRSVQARIKNTGRLGISAEETADLLWETDAGIGMSIYLDYLSRPSRRRMQANGELGTLEWNGISGTVTLAMAGAPAMEIKSAQERDGMYLAQDQAFMQTCQGQTDPRLATGEDGVKALAVCDAARLASETRREVKVEYL